MTETQRQLAELVAERCNEYRGAQFVLKSVLSPEWETHSMSLVDWQYYVRWLRPFWERLPLEATLLGYLHGCFAVERADRAVEEDEMD